MSNTYSVNPPQAMEKLLEAIDKGIDLLTNKNLDKDLYDAFERYVISTLKLVDAYCQTCYSNDFVQFNRDYTYNGFNSCISNSSIYYWNLNIPRQTSFLKNVGMTNYNIETPNYGIGMSAQSKINYQDKLKEVLKKLVSIAKIVAYK